MKIPILETDRLRLREWRLEDLDALAELQADAEAMRFVGGALTRFDSWRALTGMAGHWVLRGYGLWAVERKSDAAMLGRVGLIHHENWPQVEVGWALARPAWGKGYATEAARAALDYAFTTLPVDKMISLIDPENISSQKVAAHLGETRGPRHMQNAGKVDFACDIWSITRGEWERLKNQT